MFANVCWFNFEINCKSWGPPWYATILNTNVELCSYRYEVIRNGNREYETAEFPIYYKGTVQDAESIPPEIILSELRDVAEDLHHCKEDLLAVDSFAPGGMDYEHLRRTTQYKQTISGDTGKHVWSE
jgi:hypothetical protein